jgi:hypothetical protein
MYLLIGLLSSWCYIYVCSIVEVVYPDNAFALCTI